MITSPRTERPKHGFPSYTIVANEMITEENRPHVGSPKPRLPRKEERISLPIINTSDTSFTSGNPPNMVLKTFASIKASFYRGGNTSIQRIEEEWEEFNVTGRKADTVK